jgi:acetylornithine/succinyldiaminopimelate/putrescine aminotransferase
LSHAIPSPSELSAPSPAIRGGEGSYVVDADGACCIDCSGAAPLGHGHARIVAAATRQLRKLHAPVETSTAQLSHAAMSLLPLPADWRSMLLATGEQAIDAAATMAARATGRGEIVLLTTGLQGRTQVALSTSGLPDFRTRATPVHCVHHVRFGDIAVLSDLLRRRAGHIAAVIAEPIATADVTIAGDNYWRLVRQMTENQGVLLVLDESNTAPYRTGRCFAADVLPDAIVLGPALANGLPIGAVLCGESLLDFAEPVTPANPVAIAAAEAMIEGVSDPAFPERVQIVGRRLLATLQRLAGRRPKLSQARGAGLLLGVEVWNHEYLLESLRDHGVLATMSDNTLVLRPPLTIGDADAAQITDALYACLN